MRVRMAAGYYNNANPALLDRIPSTVSSVLEVGCGAGALARCLKARLPSVRYVGCERQSTVADAAKEAGVDHVLLGDVEQLFDQIQALGPYDCIIYGDVLEHLIEPEALLERHCSLLSEGGLILASIPNAQHWSMLVNLIQGTFPRNESGLFDRTHLRWFTRRDILHLLEHLRLVPLEVSGQSLGTQQESEAVAQGLSPLLPALGVDPTTLRENLAPLQWVVRASFVQPRPLHLDCIGLSPQTQAGMAHVRMLQPLEALCRQPGVTGRFSDQGLQLLDATVVADRVLIWQRPTLVFPEALEKLRFLISRGYVVVVEYDDDPNFWPEIAHNQYLTFRGVHAIQVSTPELASIVREHNPEVAVFANSVPELPLLPPQRLHDEQQPISLFFAALNRQSDWEPYLNVLRQCLIEFKDQLRLDIVHDHALDQALDVSNKTFTPTLPYSAYCERMACADLVWMPLLDTPFNRKKSDLKFLEAAARGCVAVASTTVYSSVIKDQATGCLFDSPEDLYEILRTLILDPAKRRKIGAQARAWVGQNRLQSMQIQAREAWYRDLCARRGQLTDQIYQRVPELMN